MLKAKLLGATAAAESLAIEDVFSTWLYTGTGAAQTITNGIDLAGEGGLVWTKPRSAATLGDHILVDSERGNFQIQTNTTAANNAIASFNFSSDGYVVPGNLRVNESSQTYASWTFRKAPRFFDVVTYTGTGSARTIAHSLNTTPGMIICKPTSGTGNWAVWHRSNGNNNVLYLNLTLSNSTSNTVWNNTAPTADVFSVGSSAATNENGVTYVAYLYAHDPLGPSGDGSDGLIACGSVSAASISSPAVVDLGWEPQWILWKNSSVTDNWHIFDTMRGIGAFNTAQALLANTSGAESTLGNATYPININSTGFSFNPGYFGWGGASDKFIYIAIRRGPMREPTVGTEVFDTVLATNDSQELTTGFPVDLFLQARRAVPFTAAFDRMRGSGNRLYVYNTGAESSTGGVGQFDSNTSFAPFQFGSTTSIAHWAFRRAPGFFDVVAYTGTGSARTVPHNLGVAPELMIVKKRSGGSTWPVWIKPVFDISSSGRLLLNETTERQNSSAAFNSTAPTDEVFTLGTDVDTNDSGATYIAYLFASLPGVSKVGSYTGDGSSQTINCGFTTGARFILIKRTDSTGDWYVWDTARGIVTGNDPHLSLNTNAAEVTTDDTIDPDSTGFIVNQVAATNVNVNTATYIYLAIA
jgi:hypothetical protein